MPLVAALPESNVYMMIFLDSRRHRLTCNLQTTSHRLILLRSYDGEHVVDRFSSAFRNRGGYERSF